MKVTPKYKIVKVGNHYKIMIEAFYRTQIKRSWWFGYKTERVWGWYQTNTSGGVLNTGGRNYEVYKTFAEAKRVYDYWVAEAKPIKI